MPGGLVSVLIPVHDEERTVEQVIRRVAELPFESEIVVVDDGSRDGTPAILERLVQDGVPGLRVYTQPRTAARAPRSGPRSATPAARSW